MQFLAAAELVETDLWGQYSELATHNPGYRAALQSIKDSLPDYVNGDFADEMSHASFINAFLIAAGQQPVNLDAFRTLPSVPVQGVQNIGRLTKSDQPDGRHQLLQSLPGFWQPRLRRRFPANRIHY